MTKSVVGLRRNPKTLPKANLYQKNSWSLFGDPLQPGESIESEKYAQQIDVKHWTLQRRQPVYGSTQWAQFFTTPDHTLPNTSEVERIGLQSFASSAMFTWPLANWLPLLWASWELFAGEMLPQPAGVRKCFPRVCWISKHRYLCYRNKQAFLVGKNALTIMVPILINKDVFEPSYRMERLEISSKKLEIPREHFMQRWAR